jgi:ABC-2 type transport system permease protein
VNLRLYRHLLARTLRGKRLLGASALASVAGIAAWVSMAGIDTEHTADIYRTITASVPAATLSIALLIVATATMRDERDGGTLPYVFLTPMSATAFAISSSAAALTAALTVAVIGWIPGWVGSWIMTGSWDVAVPALALYGIAAVGYAAAFVPLGYLFDRSLIIGLAYIFVWEGILATVVAGITPSSIWRIAMSAYADVDELPGEALDMLGTVEPGKWGAIATIVVLVGLGTSVLGWSVRTRDAV